MALSNGALDHRGACSAGRFEQPGEFKHRSDAGRQIPLFAARPPADRPGQRHQAQRRQPGGDDPPPDFPAQQEDGRRQHSDTESHAEAERMIGPKSEQPQPGRFGQHDRQPFDQQPHAHPPPDVRQPRDELSLQAGQIGDGFQFDRCHEVAMRFVGSCHCLPTAAAVDAPRGDLFGGWQAVRRAGRREHCLAAAVGISRGPGPSCGSRQAVAQALPKKLAVFRGLRIDPAPEDRDRGAILR